MAKSSINLSPSCEDSDNLKLYSAIVEHMTNEVHIWQVVRNEEGKIVTWKLKDANPAALKAWNKSIDDVRGKTTDEIFEIEATKTFMPIVEKIFTSGQPHFWQTYFAGTNQLLDMISIPVGDCFISTGLDITAKKQAENFIDQAHRMDSLGIIAGGVAHDFNNILAIILGNAHMLEKREQDNKLLIHIKSIIEAGDKAKDLTSLILSFARETSGKKEPINLNENIHKMVELFSGSVTNNINITFLEANEPLTITANVVHLNQVILNIAGNAIKSMTEKEGELTISLKKTIMKDQSDCPVDTFTCAMGEYAEISIKDTGDGIPQNVLDHIYEPFFTASKDGSGTGLGLSIVKTIMADHGGCIKIDTEIGKGTEFKVLFPLL